MPIGLSIHPYESTDNPATVQVKNLAPNAVRVTTQNLVMHSHCTGTAATGMVVRPAAFVLQPGQVRKVTVTVPANVKADFGVIFAGIAVHHQSGVDLIAGGVGFQVLSGGLTHTCHGLAVPPHQSSGLSSVAVGAVGGILIVAAIIAAIMARSIRRRRHEVQLWQGPEPYSSREFSPDDQRSHYEPHDWDKWMR